MIFHSLLQHIRYLTLHCHSPMPTPAAPRAYTGEREVKEQQREKQRQNWKTGRRTTVTPESHWRAAVKGQWAGGKDNQSLTESKHTIISRLPKSKLQVKQQCCGGSSCSFIWGCHFGKPDTSCPYQRCGKYQGVGKQQGFFYKKKAQHLQYFH